MIGLSSILSDFGCAQEEWLEKSLSWVHLPRRFELPLILKIVHAEDFEFKHLKVHLEGNELETGQLNNKHVHFSARLSYHNHFRYLEALALILANKLKGPFSLSEVDFIKFDGIISSEQDNLPVLSL